MVCYYCEDLTSLGALTCVDDVMRSASGSEGLHRELTQELTQGVGRLRGPYTLVPKFAKAQ